MLLQMRRNDVFATLAKKLAVITECLYPQQLDVSPMAISSPL